MGKCTEWSFQKKSKWPKKHLKKYSPFLAIKECKSKLHYDSTLLLLEWLPSKTQMTTNVGEDVGGKRNPHTLVVVYTTRKNSMTLIVLHIHIHICTLLVYLFFFFLVKLSLNSEIHACKASSLRLEPHQQFILLWSFWRWGTCTVFAQSGL
jgi:hypothetical protein